MVLAALVGILLFMICSLGINYGILKWAWATQQPWLQTMALAEQRKESARAQEKLQGHLSAMAVRLGELQAQSAKLDALSEHLAKAVGMTEKEIPKANGQGGIEVMPKAFTASELGELIDELTLKLTVQNDHFHVFDGLLLENSANRRFLPTQLPVAGTSWRSSDFGYRVDPFTGMKAFHEGIDFSANPGTPVIAAASGRVTRAGVHPQYGKIVEIDHGNGLMTRYAHNSDLLVNEGDLVVRGQAVALVGSTGRSTGPHLHFEVRLNGVAQNPARFFNMAEAG
jgi:murein DD-endopeptidase MepM/ murein hydrolase activator NlpD